MVICALLLAAAVFAQNPAPPPEPPEEDESLKSQEYALNPVQAKKEVTAGNFYSKKGNYRAAAGRYREATLWDPGWAEAFLKWGEASEKLLDYRSAKEAFQKYFELAEDQKSVAAIKKRMAKWPVASTKR